MIETLATVQAEVASIDWSAFGIGFLGALLGTAGSIGAAVFVFGRWQGKTDQRLDYLEERMQSGRHPISEVPVLKSRIQQINESIDRLERLIAKVDKDTENYVTQQECERRHDV